MRVRALDLFDTKVDIPEATELNHPALSNN